MPREWHDRHALKKIDDIEKRAFYKRILADRKPYFMRYIYPSLMKQYNVYTRNTERNAMREFRMGVTDLKELPQDAKNERQREFLMYYDIYMPVGVGACVTNRICLRIEREFDGWLRKHNASIGFDYAIMRSGAEYSASQYNAIKRLYAAFNKRLQSYAVYADYERIDECDSCAELSIMNDEFRRDCDAVCPNQDSLCNIVLDLCYTRNSTKKFAWSMCSENIIHNLLRNNNNIVSFPTEDVKGDIEYCGNRFSLSSKKIGVDS